jgi:hypothetical protein
MPNVQQPEMRHSGKDPLVQESTATIPDQQAAGPGGGRPEHHGKVPPDQQSPYGPHDNDTTSQE